MNLEDEKYFAKDFVELVFKASDYITNNIDKITHVERAGFKIINNKKLVKLLVEKYKNTQIDYGEFGGQIIAIATAIKTIIEERNYLGLKFFERDGKFYAE